MVLPSRDVVQDIRNLINEITGFGENEENFYICEQYCLSHVMHHTYPSVNKNEVKKVIDGYILRFFIHGYFKVADGLEAEVKKFLSSDLLFKKNPEFDIQWVLLSLLTGLASNLTAVSKLPKMLPVDEDDEPSEDINWGEYLKEGLPCYQYQHFEDSDSENLSFSSQSSEISGEGEEKMQSQESSVKKLAVSEIPLITEVSSTKVFHPSRQHIIDELVKRREEEINYMRDVVLRGNFIKELGFFINSNFIGGALQILSEFELVGYVLKQFLTGENVFNRKGITNPATCSLTKGTIKSYLASIQPYVNMITVFKEFSNEVAYFDTDMPGKSKGAIYSERNSQQLLNSDFRHVFGDGKFPSVYCNLNKMTTIKKPVPNVVKLYNLALMEALNSFENKILFMSEYQNSYTLLKVLNELRPSFNDLSSLFAVHLSATANWLNEPNWLCSTRILMTLYKAILNSTSNRLGFLYMNMFLYCFQAYLDITDSWISCLSLNDPHDEYIIYKCDEPDDCGSSNCVYRIRPYKDELARAGIKEIPVLDYLANKMIHVGHSIDVLHQLDRSLMKNQNYSSSALPQVSLYKQLLKDIKKELRRQEEAMSVCLNECRELSLYNGKSTIGTRTTDSSEELNVQNYAIDNNNSNAAGAYSYKGNLDLSCKGITGTDENITAKDIALNNFCRKMCQEDQMDIIEKSIWPLTVILDTNAKFVLNARVLHTCDLAKDVVVNEFQLKTHLRLLRNIFLFNDPHLILPFMCALFNQDSCWRNSYVLTVHLRECIESRYRDQAQYLRVSVEENPTETPTNILQAIDGITINYQVGWPLRLIFTPHIMTLYNNVFRHLFKLHWAHETLCKLRFSDIDSKAPDIVKSSHRRLELLRFWCMSTLARLRSYFMAQISTPFDLQLNCYQHLKHVIKAHELFIKKIHSRCLLDEESADNKGLIFDMLIPLCYDVYQFWSTKHAIPDSKLTITENVFLKSQQQFPRLMAELEEE